MSKYEDALSQVLGPLDLSCCLCKMFECTLEHTLIRKGSAGKSSTGSSTINTTGVSRLGLTFVSEIYEWWSGYLSFGVFFLADCLDVGCRELLTEFPFALTLSSEEYEWLWRQTVSWGAFSTCDRLEFGLLRRV